MGNMYVVNKDFNTSKPRSTPHDDLVVEYRLPKFDEKGKENKLSKKYLDKSKWIQIIDPDLYIRTHNQYLHFIADEIDDWWIFMTINNPKLNSDEELKKKSDELKKKFDKELRDYAFDHDITKNQLESYTYYQLKNITDTFKK